MPQHKGIFSFFHLPYRTAKPRTTGLTMVEGDYMLAVAGMYWLHDLVDWGAAYVDLFKVGPTMMFQPEELVARKLGLLNQHDIRPYLGGNTTETAIMQDCFLPLWREARGLGINTIEISDTIQPLTLPQKVKLIKMARKEGITVFAEVGKKLIGAGGPRTHMPLSEVTRQMKECLDAGADKIVYEHTELEDLAEKGEGLGSLLEVAGTIGADNIMFEVPVGEWKRVSPFAAFYIQNFGTNVNIGDVDPRHVLQIQKYRMGFGTRSSGKVAPI
ncbi:MAG: phosphosulfolactate synthase [Chloroflexi bacterium]|nr:phosphosulfolactate synthase [Chloroflexota bacterium]